MINDQCFGAENYRQELEKKVVDVDWRKNVNAQNPKPNHERCRP